MSRTFLKDTYSEGEATAIADRLFSDRYGISAKDRILNPDADFNAESDLNDDLKKLASGVPVQHLTGFEWFEGMKIRVGPDVLIPRPETAELLQFVYGSVSRLPGKIADICTGSGCIALALRKHWPDAAITATDIDESSLRMASASERDNFGDNRVLWLRHDVLHDGWTDDVPDLIVCNPPYIMRSESDQMERNVLEHEPHRALFAEGNDPLVFYKRILGLFRQHKDTLFFFELNPLTATQLKAHCDAEGLTMKPAADMSGKIRFAMIASEKD